jgi:hypothetical protein
MKFKVQVVTLTDDGEESMRGVACVEREELTPANLGVSIVDSKAILQGIQEVVVEWQMQEYLDSRRSCPDCGKLRHRNYGERYRNGERISTGFVESTVNQVVSKRMVKKQQMRWSQWGAHLLLQIRTRVLNGDWEDTFRRWYPGFRADATRVRVSLSDSPLVVPSDGVRRLWRASLP